MDHYLLILLLGNGWKWWFITVDGELRSYGRSGGWQWPKCLATVHGVCPQLIAWPRAMCEHEVAISQKSVTYGDWMNHYWLDHVRSVHVILNDIRHLANHAQCQ